MYITLYQIDAFPDSYGLAGQAEKALFKGNPAAVIPLTEWLPDDLMLLIAAENNLSETAFFVPEGDRFALRWFTPVAEVDLCGHATLATAHVLWTHEGYTKKAIHFDTRSGELIVQKVEDGYQMDFPADQPQYIAGASRLDGIDARFLSLYRGKDDFLAVLPDEATLAALQPDFRALAQLDARGIICTAPGDEVDFVSRCFYPQYGIDEDPVTGSAHTLLTPFWAEKIGKQELTARQISRRGGFLTCLLKGDRVLLTGGAVTFLEGRIRVR